VGAKEDSHTLVVDGNLLPNSPPQLAQGFFLSGEKSEEILDVGDFKGISDAIAHPDQGKRFAIFAMVHVGAHQGADSGGVDVGDGGEIDDESPRRASPNRILKLKEIRKDYRASKCQDALIGLRAALFVDLEGFLGLQSHAQNLSVGAASNC
jgi:hypothetical protein